MERFQWGGGREEWEKRYREEEAIKRWGEVKNGIGKTENSKNLYVQPMDMN